MLLSVLLFILCLALLIPYVCNTLLSMHTFTLLHNEISWGWNGCHPFVIMGWKVWGDLMLLIWLYLCLMHHHDGGTHMYICSYIMGSCRLSELYVQSHVNLQWCQSNGGYCTFRSDAMIIPPLAPPCVIDVKLVINVFDNLFSNFVYHCICQGKPYSNISKEYIVKG